MIEHMRYVLAWTLGWPELLVVLVIALLIFGRKLPEIARGLGKSLTEFKKGIHEAEETKDEFVDEVTARAYRLKWAKPTRKRNSLIPR
jgi:sec-independent protein translocase protein TatA